MAKSLKATLEAELTKLETLQAVAEVHAAGRAASIARIRQVLGLPPAEVSEAVGRLQAALQDREAQALLDQQRIADLERQVAAADARADQAEAALAAAAGLDGRLDAAVAGSEDLLRQVRDMGAQVEALRKASAVDSDLRNALAAEVATLRGCVSAEEQRAFVAEREVQALRARLADLAPVPQPPVVEPAEEPGAAEAAPAEAERTRAARAIRPVPKKKDAA